jgi:hypothetical protein
VPFYVLFHTLFTQFAECTSTDCRFPIAVAARSKARTVFARSNTEIVGSNPPGGMDVCVRLFRVYIVSSETASRPKRRLMRTYHWISQQISL